MEGDDMSKVCRLCLKGGEVMCPIFSPNQQNGNSASLPHRIMSCAQVKVFEGDGLPSNVCTTCLSQVDRSYQFKLLCEKSDSTLRGNIQDRNSASDSESLDGGEMWDMNKFTPEVIINEEADENNSEVNGVMEGGGYYPLSQVEAILRHHGTEIKVQAGGEVVVGQPLLPLPPPEAVLHPGRPPPQPIIIYKQQPTPGPSPNRSRRCRGGDKLFKCRQCNKSYSFSSALSRHKAVHNTALRPHVCKVCNKGFTQLDKLLRHQKTHSLDMMMTCDLCSRPFKTFSAYQKHRLMGNCSEVGDGGNLGQCVRCDRCGGEFGSMVDLSRHACQTMANQNPQEEAPQQPQAPQAQATPQPQGRQSKGRPEFRCDVCQKNFATRGSLDVHSTIHTGVRPFVCSVCQKSFRHKVNLMEHFQRKHSQVRPYICDVCAARFVTKQELVRHYRKHIGD